MLNNSWFKKERPLQGLLGSGGGLAVGSSSDPFEATGGTKITDGDYTYHVFISDTPAPAKSLVISEGTRENCEILVVGGGGGTGFDNAGGAGAGGVAHVPAITLSPGSIAVVIGAASPYSPTRAVNFPWKGNDSTFAHPFGTITAKGGGCPGAQNNSGPYEINDPAQDGGSGAGGRRTNPNADPSYTAAQSSAIQPTQNPGYPVTVNNYGNDGGSAESGGATYWFGGGGGGAGAAGQSYNSGHDGGAGQPFPTFPGPVTAPALAPVSPTAESDYTTARGPTHLIAGGGGGSSETPSSAGSGGGGGGGTGGGPSGPATGIYGTGGGAGGGNGSGGPGGSGIVMVRYLT